MNRRLMIPVRPPPLGSVQQTQYLAFFPNSIPEEHEKGNKRLRSETKPIH